MSLSNIRKRILGSGLFVWHRVQTARRDGKDVDLILALKTELYPHIERYDAGLLSVGDGLKFTGRCAAVLPANLHLFYMVDRVPAVLPACGAISILRLIGSFCLISVVQEEARCTRVSLASTSPPIRPPIWLPISNGCDSLWASSAG
jgi:hypothetical protein